jgi:integrase
VPKLKRKRKAANGQGSIIDKLITRPDGSTYIRWEGYVSSGKDGRGKRRRTVVYGLTQNEVVEKIDKLKRKLSSGLLDENKLTLSQYLEQWLNHLKGKTKPRTLEGYRYSVERYVTNEPKNDEENRKVPSSFGQLKLSKLTALQIQMFLDNINEKISADCANKVRRVLHTAFEQAVMWELLPQNLVGRTESYLHRRKDMQIWSPQDTVKFLSEARTNRLYAMFYLAISTGLRSGELRGLLWSDLNKNVLHVQRSLARVQGELVFSTPKTEKGKRRVSLDDETLEVLAMHLKQQQAERVRLGDNQTDLGLIFCKQDGSYITNSNLEGIWNRLLATSGVPRVRIHDLRHLNVSLRRRLGQDAKLIADQVGHSDPAFTTRLYTHLFEDDIAKAAVTLSAVLPNNSSDAKN